MARLKDHVEALEREVRTLQETVEVYELNYGWLADLVNDAACHLKAGEPIDQAILDEFVRYEWKDDGLHIKRRDCDRVTAFSAHTRHAQRVRSSSSNSG